MTALLVPHVSRSVASRVRPQVRRRSLVSTPAIAPAVDDSRLTGSPSAWREFCDVPNDDPEVDDQTVDAGQSVGLGSTCIAEFVLDRNLLASIEALATDGMTVDEVVAVALAAYVATNGKAVA